MATSEFHSAPVSVGTTLTSADTAADIEVSAMTPSVAPTEGPAITSSHAAAVPNSADTEPATTMTGLKPAPLAQRHSDKSVMEKLTQIAQSGHKFAEKAPPSVQQAILESSLHIVHQRDMFEKTYFLFLQGLLQGPHDPSTAAIAVRLGTFFVFNTYFHAHESLLQSASLVSDSIGGLLSYFPSACETFAVLLCEHVLWLAQCLLECPHENVRNHAHLLVLRTLSCLNTHGVEGEPRAAELQILKVRLAGELVGLIDKGAPEHFKNCGQLFSTIRDFIQSSMANVQCVLDCDIVARLQRFLFGESSTGVQSTERRWSTAQAKLFGSVHSAISVLVRSFDSRWTHHHEPLPNAFQLHPGTEHALPADVLAAFVDNDRYLAEAVSCALDNADVSLLLQYVSWGNMARSQTVIRLLVRELGQVGDTAVLSRCITAVARISDSLQTPRLVYFMRGNADGSFHGFMSLLNVHLTQPYRVYKYVRLVADLLDLPAVCDCVRTERRRWLEVVKWLDSQSYTYAGFNNSGESVLQRTTSVQSTLDSVNELCRAASDPSGHSMDTLETAVD